MATLVSKDPVEALVQYARDVKPYHTKIIDILVEYIYTDPVDITISERLEFNVDVKINSNHHSTTLEISFDEDLQFVDGSALVYYDNLNVIVDDRTAADGYNNDTFSIGTYSVERNRPNVDIDGSGLSSVVDHTTNIFTTPQPHNFVDDQEVYLWAVGGGLPYYDHYGDNVQMMPYNPYYVIYVSPTEFKLAFTVGGSEMDIIDPNVVELNSYDDFYVGGGVYEPFVDVNSTTTTDITATSFSDSLSMSNEIIFNQQTPNTGSNETRAEASFTDSITFHVEHLELRDSIGVGITEIADAGVTSGASFIGSWDMPYWDIGSFDGELGAVIRLYST